MYVYAAETRKSVLPGVEGVEKKIIFSKNF